MSVQVAKAEIEKMINVLSAYQGAKQVLDVLANIDQVTSETYAKLDAAKADLAAAEDKLRVSRETSETLLAHAKAIVAEAQVAAAATAESAKHAAATLRREADDEISALKIGVADKQAELADLQALVAAARAELNEIDGALATAREAYRKALLG